MTAVAWHEGKVLLLGARGMLGCELAAALRRRMGAEAEGKLIGLTSGEMDIRDAAAVDQRMAHEKPSLVINAAAYTNVDGCESDEATAMAVNAEGPGHLARACAAARCPLVHFSTDFVFDGTATRPYRPDDAAGPVSMYGRSKWEGEQAIRAAGEGHLIIRTSWLFGPHGRNFVETILARATSGQPLRVVTDQAGSPTLAADLAEAVVHLLDADARGTTHFCNAGVCSWHEFATAIVAEAGIDATVGTMVSAELDRPARRPAYSALDTSDYTQRTGRKPAPWRDALRRYMTARHAVSSAGTS